MSDISIKLTNRGFVLGKFKDKYNQPCSIQKSSLATEDCIWLGVEASIDLNTGEVLGDNNRMHLTQDHVKMLLPFLTHFAETGELPYLPR
jgi:hypothetical protein